VDEGRQDEPPQERVMGFFFSRRKRIGQRMHVNIGRRGVSLSTKAGPFSLSTRGNASVRLGKGAGFRKKLW
jgi:hypothetical protein